MEATEKLLDEAFDLSQGLKREVDVVTKLQSVLKSDKLWVYWIEEEELQKISLSGEAIENVKKMLEVSLKKHEEILKGLMR